MSARHIARYGVLLCVALILGWVEHMLPIAPGIPGIKIGLANMLILYALYAAGITGAALLMGLKVILSGLLFSGISAMGYGIAGGAASLVVMLAARRIPGIGVVGVSVLGAMAHMTGQVLLACFLVQAQAVLFILPLLLLTGILAGMVTGVLARHLLGIQLLNREQQRGVRCSSKKSKPV